MQISLTESQFKVIIENVVTEILPFIGEGLYYNTKQGQKYVSYRPGANGKIDDKIFNNDKSLRVRQVLLPKSGVMSYNLYDIKDMVVNKSLKHGIDMQKKPVLRDESMNLFVNRSVLLMKHILGNFPVDIITYPQSSSQFNQEITSKLLAMYPQSESLKLHPELLVKCVRNIYVNADVAKQVGLSDTEINTLQRRVEKWKKDEDIRDLRRDIERLKQEIADIVARRGTKQGRPSKEMVNKRQQINLYQNDIKNLRKGIGGKDPTVDEQGNVKDWQIKSIDDRMRRSIEGIFTLNPQYINMQYKLRGKNIVLFDDNLSSGATLDDVCLALQQLGVGQIMAFTLGTIEPTLYNPKDRMAWKLQRKSTN